MSFIYENGGLIIHYSSDGGILTIEFKNFDYKKFKKNDKKKLDNFILEINENKIWRLIITDDYKDDEIKYKILKKIKYSYVRYVKFVYMNISLIQEVLLSLNPNNKFSLYIGNFINNNKEIKEINLNVCYLNINIEESLDQKEKIQKLSKLFNSSKVDCLSPQINYSKLLINELVDFKPVEIHLKYKVSLELIEKFCEVFEHIIIDRIEKTNLICNVKQNEYYYTLNSLVVMEANLSSLSMLTKIKKLKIKWYTNDDSDFYGCLTNLIKNNNYIEEIKINDYVDTCERRVKKIDSFIYEFYKHPTLNEVVVLDPDYLCRLLKFKSKYYFNKSINKYSFVKIEPFNNCKLKLLSYDLKFIE